MTNGTENMTAITGNTYPVKDSLKALGARWNATDKCWMIAPEKAEQAKAIVAGAPVPNAKTFDPRSFVRSAVAPRKTVRECACGKRHGIWMDSGEWVCGDCI